MPFCSRLHGQKGRIAFLHSSAVRRVRCKDALNDLAYDLSGTKSCGGEKPFDLL
jgi:hypothetical protein